MKKSSSLIPTSSFLRSRGFTIIELLVVIAIIALLTGIIMTSLVGSKAKARDAKRVSDLGNIQLALELYYDRCKEYPSGLYVTTQNGCPVTSPQVNLGTFISNIPQNQLPNDEGVTTYGYEAVDTNGDSKPDIYLLRVVLESNNAALLDDIDVLPQNWIDNSYITIGDPSTVPCDDSVVSGNLPRQYCLISN